MAQEQDKPNTTTTEPTAEEVQQVQQKAEQVAQAGVEASESGKDPAAAMKAERDRVKLELTDDQLEKMAAMFSDKSSDATIEKLEQRGAFDSPPEPVQAPEPERAPPTPAEQREQPQDPPPQPVRRTWAHKFLGVQ